MKAIVYTKSVPGKLVLSEVEKPVPSDDEVLIQIVAASVNAADYRSLKMGIIPKRKIFGADIAGIVETVGKNIVSFKPGDQVIGDLSAYGFGGFASYVAVPEKALVSKPSSLGFEKAAALPLAAVTALQALRNKGTIHAGQQVLIVGSGGGVGSYAVQLAKFFGAEVTAVCSTRNVEAAFAMGASRVIDYTKEDLSNSQFRYELIFAINGNQSLRCYKRLLNPHGKYVMVGGSLPQIFKSLVFGPFFSLGSRKMLSLTAKPNKDDLQFIADLAEAGNIIPVIDRTYTLEQVPEAMHYAGQGHAKGKIVVLVQ